MGILDPHSTKCVLWGLFYSEGYKCKQPETKKTFLSANLTFNDKEMFSTGQVILTQEMLLERKSWRLILVLLR